MTCSARRQRSGTWQRVFTELQARADAEKLITWGLNVDSSVCRARQYAAGASNKGDLRKEPPGGVAVEPDGHGLGRSRGGPDQQTKRGSRSGRPQRSDLEDHKARHAVECGINRLTGHRAVAPRYDELAVRYEATALVAAINEWLRPAQLTPCPLRGGQQLMNLSPKPERSGV